MAYRYKTKGTCSVYIDVDMDGNVLKNAVFTVAVMETCRASALW